MSKRVTGLKTSKCFRRTEYPIAKKTIVKVNKDLNRDLLTSESDP